MRAFGGDRSGSPAAITIPTGDFTDRALVPISCPASVFPAVPVRILDLVAIRAVPAPAAIRVVPAPAGNRAVPALAAIRAIPGRVGNREVPGRVDIAEVLATVPDRATSRDSPVSRCPGAMAAAVRLPLVGVASTRVGAPAVGPAADGSRTVSSRIWAGRIVARRVSPECSARTPFAGPGGAKSG